MNPILISPHIDEQSMQGQINQIKSYLYQFKEQVEMILSNIDSENLSQNTLGILDKVSEIERSSKIKSGNYSSEIKQLANEITLEVSRATQAEGELSASISLTDSEVSARVRKGTSYNGAKITSSGISCSGTGSLTISMNNIELNSNGDLKIKGNAEFGGKLTAPSGSIGGWDIADGVIQKGFASLEPDCVVIGNDSDNNTSIVSGSVSTNTLRVRKNLTILGSMNWGKYFVTPSEIDGDYYLKVVGYSG